MKKILSVLLAVIMMFTVMSVAFAEDATDVSDESTTVAAEEDTTADDSAFNIDDLPVWVLKVGPKFAKVILKIVSIFVKIAFKLGLIDSEAIIDQISSALASTAPAEDTSAELSTEVVLA